MRVVNRLSASPRGGVAIVAPELDAEPVVDAVKGPHEAVPLGPSEVDGVGDHGACVRV